MRKTRHFLAILSAVLVIGLATGSQAQVIDLPHVTVGGSSATVAASPDGYVVFDLGTLGGAASRAYDISNTGLVVGWAERSGGLRSAFLWDGGQMVALGTLAGDRQSMALGVNNAGAVVGESWPGTFAVDPPFYNDNASAFYYDGTALTDLGTLGGGMSRAYAVNDGGLVVGVSSNASHDYHAFSWLGGVMSDLGTLGGYDSEAWAVTNLGEAVGYSDLPGYNFVACRWSDGQPNALAGLAHGLGSNDLGVVAGFARAANGYFQAAIWQDGTVTSLGTLGGRKSQANDINDSGQAVGESELADYSTHAFVYDDGQLIDLNTLVADPAWTLVSATAINDAGEIVGYGTHNGAERAFLLVPPGLRIHGPAPGYAGVLNTVLVLGAPANADVYLYYGYQAGATSTGCGATIDIASPVVTVATADDDGVAQFLLPLPPESSGQTLRLQAYSPSTCEVSRLVIHVVP